MLQLKLSRPAKLQLWIIPDYLSLHNSFKLQQWQGRSWRCLGVLLRPWNYVTESRIIVRGCHSPTLSIYDFLRMLHSWSAIPVDEMSAESWINEVRGELAHAGSVIGPGSPVANNLRLSPSTQSVPLHHGSRYSLQQFLMFPEDRNHKATPNLYNSRNPCLVWIWEYIM